MRKSFAYCLYQFTSKKERKENHKIIHKTYVRRKEIKIQQKR